MADHLSKEKRSWNMRRIRSKNTGPEILLRKALHKKGLRYRLHDRKLPGRPDIVLKKHKTVILVHGCFWHRHGCPRSTTPKTNRKYWQEKFARNIKRDQDNENKLKELGWHVIVVWECEISNDLSSTVDKIFDHLRENKKTNIRTTCEKTKFADGVRVKTDSENRVFKGVT